MLVQMILREILQGMVVALGAFRRIPRNRLLTVGGLVRRDTIRRQPPHTPLRMAGGIFLLFEVAISGPVGAPPVGALAMYR
jgi:hypothetical protein